MKTSSPPCSAEAPVPDPAESARVAPRLRVEWLGRLGHAEAVERMERARAQVLAGDDGAQVIWLAEHDPVITLGRSAGEGGVLASVGELSRRGIAVTRTSRGGDVTYHGPGQLMVYPVVRVRGVVRFLEAVARALADTAAAFGAAGAVWRREPAGLWLGDAKLAACGIHLRRGVSIHGFCLNVAAETDAWQLIVPCGLRGVGVTSIAAARGDDGPSVAEVASVAGPAIAAALGDRAAS